MIPVLVLTTKNAADRQQSIAACLNKMGIPFEWVEGLHWRDTTPDFLAERYDANLAKSVFGRELFPPEACIAINHQSIYRKIVDQGIEAAVILEDDSQPDTNFLKTLQALSDNPPPADVLSLHAGGGWIDTAQKLQVADNDFYRVVSQRIYYTVAYYVSAQGARRLLLDHPIFCPSDWPAPLSELRFYAAFPSVLGHNVESETEGMRGTLKHSRQLRGFRSLKCFLAYTKLQLFPGKEKNSLSRNLRLRFRQTLEFRLKWRFGFYQWVDRMPPEKLQ